MDSYCKIMEAAQTLRVLFRILRCFAHGFQSVAFRQGHLFFNHLLVVHYTTLSAAQTTQY